MKKRMKTFLIVTSIFAVITLIFLFINQILFVFSFVVLLGWITSHIFMIYSPGLVRKHFSYKNFYERDNEDDNKK
jgi:uncharacterized membrane protein